MAFDYIRKLYREIRPYELNNGETETVYQAAIKKVEKCIENNSRGLRRLLVETAGEFMAVKVDKSRRRPVVAVLGEIYMRDNAGCNGNIANRLEDARGEVIIGPFSEWIHLLHHRFTRDSRWKNDTKGLIKSKIQAIGQEVIVGSSAQGHQQILPTQRKDVSLHDMLKLSNKYVSEFYDGDPPIAMGSSRLLLHREAYRALLPYFHSHACPEHWSLSSATHSEGQQNIPFINIPYDGQDTVSWRQGCRPFMLPGQGVC